jgi:hypothetical protein
MRLGFIGRSLGVALAAGAIVWSDDSHATSMVELTTQQLTDASNVIVIGTVTEVWTEPDGERRVWTRAQIEVDEVLKGDRDIDAVVVDQIGGAFAGKTVAVHGSARFSRQERVMVFLEELDSGHLAPVGMFQGKYTVQIDPRVREDIVQRMTVDWDQDWDGRFLPLPEMNETLTLEAFRGSVEDSVAQGWNGEPIVGASMERLEWANRDHAKTEVK